MPSPSARLSCLVVFLVAFAGLARAADVAVLSGDDLKLVLPSSFYFEGRSGPTQVRNAAAVRFGEKRHVIASLVDTAGYSSDVRDKYEGFLITDSPISVGGKNLAAGAYGFGFAKDGTLTVLDVGGKSILSVKGTKDSELRTPKPLNLSPGDGGVRFYRGRDFVVLLAK